MSVASTLDEEGGWRTRATQHARKGAQSLGEIKGAERVKKYSELDQPVAT